jgi:hypothetical protein
MSSTPTASFTAPFEAECHARHSACDAHRNDADSVASYSHLSDITLRRGTL